MKDKKGGQPEMYTQPQQQVEVDSALDLFTEDVREKKITANAGKSRVYRPKRDKGVTFYSDMLRGKAKKEYTKAGELIITSPYDKIMPLEEYKSYDKEKRIIALTEMLKRHSRKDIADAWGSRPALDSFIYRYGLSTEKHDMSRSKAAAPNNTTITQKPLSSRELEELFAFTLSLHFSESEMTGNEVIKKISSMSKIFVPGYEYHLTLTIKENIENE